MYTNHEISPDEHARWWALKSVDPQTRLMIFEHAGRPAGFVSITDYLGEGGSATWAFYAGDKAPPGTGRLMEYHMLRTAFEDLKVRKLNCEVLSSNQPVIRMHQKFGFTLEGIFREAYLRGDESFDIYRLSMLSGEWFRTVKQYFESPDKDNLAGRTFKRSVRSDDALVRGFADIADVLGAAIDRRGLIYLSQSAEFLRPVLLGSEAEVVVSVRSHLGQRIAAETTVTVDGQAAMAGKVTLLLSDGDQ
jgi:UDP-4-amino-4,6-dideoxy-N-acetyl-beta-L-altrosamine N-acetyltransferase